VATAASVEDTSGDAAASYIFQRLKSSVKPETLTEELTCSICRAILYRPVSVIPCLHVFCGHCITACLELNSKCPECRTDIEEVRPTHKILSLVDHFLLARPDLAPSKAEMAEYDKANKIPPTGKRIAERKRPREVDDDDDDDDYEDSDDEDEQDHHAMPGPAAALGWAAGGAGAAIFNHFVPGFAPPPPPRACPQCTVPSPADGFLCPPGGSHLKCFSCRTPFPDRPLCGIPQSCAMCRMPFCDLYLGGCASQAGVGMLQAVKDHTMASSPLPVRTFGGNTIEQTILSAYLASAGVSIQDAWLECVRQFIAGAWVPDVAAVVAGVQGGSPGVGAVSPESVVCRPCSLRVFAGLLYHFRRAIPREALPPSVVSRPNCWYGRDCRTQFHNVAHAQNYNHACPQEKRKE
jgi:hypothetical protein